MTLANEKKDTIYQLKIHDLCNQSIKYNEDILDYTKQFEKIDTKLNQKLN